MSTNDGHDDRNAVTDRVTTTLLQLYLIQRNAQIFDGRKPMPQTASFWVLRFFRFICVNEH